MLTRVVIFELMQGLKSKIVLYESNYFTLINFVLQVSYFFSTEYNIALWITTRYKILFQDIGGTLPSPVTLENVLQGENIDICMSVVNTGAAEVMRQNFIDALDFVADFHSLAKIKVSLQSTLKK